MQNRVTLFQKALQCKIGLHYYHRGAFWHNLQLVLEQEPDVCYHHHHHAASRVGTSGYMLNVPSASESPKASVLLY